MKETAVLWVMNQLATLNSLKELNGIDGIEYFHRLKEIEQKGLTMEKEQKKQEYLKGMKEANELRLAQEKQMDNL
jgi:hypothetical protein